MRKATKEQKMLADRYGIEPRLAWSINVEKALGYEKFKKSQAYRDELFLDSLPDERREMEEKEAKHVELTIKYGRKV